uniref:Reverse transcriptase Ty1/copia-type domain-containing protein n=1 Tax=Solanum lycopersicum TaxID=4081 RepID=A0A3Q7GGR2_SOLLC
MKDLGAARKILGMEIIRDRESRKLFLSQRSYIQKVLERFGISSSKPIDTPVLPISISLPCSLHSEKKRRSICHEWKFDVCYGLYKVVKRIFWYLRGTSDVGLIYGGDTQLLVTGYSDSDYAGDVDTR